MHHLPTFVTLLFIFFHSISSVAAKSDERPASVDNPKSSTCSTVTFSYTVTGARATTLSNQNGSSSSTVVIVAGKYMVVSGLTANVPTANLRFIEALASNGNVVFTGSRVPVMRAPQDYSTAYFGQTYGPYTLVNPAVSGALSETFTPYIDLNNNRQYDAVSECLGDPVVLNYEVKPMAVFSYTATGSTNAFLSNQAASAIGTVAICAGGWMAVSKLIANVPISNLRFIEATTSNGNVAFGGYTVPVNRSSQDLSSSYFNHIYGIYTLLNPSITGTLSETFTPYIDTNTNGRYDTETEYLGDPVVLNYEVKSGAAQATIQAGTWSTKSIWSCGRLPTSLESVLIQHTVTVPAAYNAQAKQVLYAQNGSLLFSPVSTLSIRNDP
ncbi:hypothetical protein [Fibrella aquatilis]|uniref:Thiol-activated cytolysin n=1 Tax=Fibrella aquatilis TaxID=2817059 RepID=A0A939JZ38_9BACT|nr:hypothetical protein [Fibrella aquatilis]MBO0932739.1 hypothetical protein [Fibrella aquatilis]